MEMVCARVCVSESTMSKNIHESMVEFVGCWRRRHHRRQRQCSMLLHLESNHWWWWNGVSIMMMMIIVLLEVDVQTERMPSTNVCERCNLSANFVAGRHVYDGVCVCVLWGLSWVRFSIYFFAHLIFNIHPTTTPYRFNAYPDCIPHSKLMTIF